MDKKTLKNIITNSISSFKDNCMDVKYELKGISNSEGLFLWALIGHYKPTIFIESGVSKGRSTEIIAKAKKVGNYKQFYAFDFSEEHFEYTTKKLKGYKNVTYEVGEDSSIKVNSLRSEIKRFSIGAFVDGPKDGKNLFNLIDELTFFSKLQFVLFHDCYDGSSTKRDLLKYYPKLEDEYELIFLDSSYISDLSINDKIKQEIAVIKPDKVELVDSRYCHVGLLLRRG